LQRYARRVAAFFTTYDVVLTPTVSAPPLPLGQMVSKDQEPFRALEVGGRTVAYSGVIANITGNPAMSVPLHWNDEGLPIGMHCPGRSGAEPTLSRLAPQLEQPRPWGHRRPPTFASTAAQNGHARVAPVVAALDSRPGRDGSDVQTSSELGHRPVGRG